MSYKEIEALLKKKAIIDNYKVDLRINDRGYVANASTRIWLKTSSSAKSNSNGMLYAPTILTAKTSNYYINYL